MYQVNEDYISGETGARHRGITVTSLNPYGQPKIKVPLKEEGNEFTCSLASASSEHFFSRS